MIELNDDSLVNPKIISKNEDVEEMSLRPKKLSEFIGQTKLKKNLEVFIQAAKNRGEALEHTLFYGPPGLGKTTLSMIIAREMGRNILQTSGPAIEKPGDLASILTNLEEGDVIFIDEIHRLRPNVEEILYSALEDYHIDIMIGKGPTARSMKIELPKFTLIGATTKASMVSAPLRDRLGQVFRLEFYDSQELAQIIKRSAKFLNIEIVDTGVTEIAKRARFTPRIANRLLRRVRDFAQVEGNGQIDEKLAMYALDKLEIDKLGLDNLDRALLKIIIEKYKGGPVGVNTLAASLSEESSTIEEVHEPFLLKLGFLERTLRGRVATAEAYSHLGLSKIAQKLI